MKKIIRLTESDLTRIVKRVISEQSTYSKKDFWVGRKFTEVTNRAYIMGANYNDAKNQIGEGDRNDFEFNNVEVVAANNKEFVIKVGFGTYNPKDNRSEKGESVSKSNFYLSFKYDDVQDVKNKQLQVKEYNSFIEYNSKEAVRIYDAIKLKKLNKAKNCGHKSWEDYKNSGWKCSGGNKSSSVCPNGFKREKGGDYPFKSPDYCLGSLSKYPNKNVKLYDNMSAEVSTKNWDHTNFRKNVKQTGKWKKDSSNNPIIYDLGPEEMMTIN
jgi:hypothetical protein